MPETFAEMIAPVKTCTACPLHEHAFTNCMPGRGPADAKIMIVAQGPGGQEDMRGEVLIGRSGQLLNQMLRDAGYDPQEVFKTNATRCRAPGDRQPLPAEIDACRIHLREEIHRVRPSVIIASGDAALRALCKLSGIQSKRGKSFPLHPSFEYDCEVFPTYHAAFVLRAPHAQNIVTSDLRRVRDRATEHEAIPWARFDPMLAALPDITTGKVPGIKRRAAYAIDIEAQTFVDPKTKKKTYSPGPVQCAVATDNGVLVAQGDVDMYALLAPVALMGETIVTHNGWEYDIPKIKEHVGVPLEWGRDTMALAYLDDETQPLNLEALCVKYLGVRGWKEENDATVGSDAFALYNARDALYTLRLYDVLCERLGDRINIADAIILPGRTALRACTERGIFIDQDAVRDAKVACERTAGSARDELCRITQNAKFNPNSPAQVANVLVAEGLNLPTTPTGKPATGKGVLQSALDRLEETENPSPFLRALLEYRKAQKTLSTYIEPYEEAANGDGRIHPEYTVIKTVTGRTSSRNPNAQNLDRRYKHFFSAPPGYVWIEADYAGIEFRLAAWVAGEQEIIRRYQENPAWDPHRFFAAILYDKPEADVTKEQRQVAKSANFSQLYVGGPGTIIEYGMKQDPPIRLNYRQALRIHQTWHAAFPAFRPFYQATWDEVRRNGYVQTATGRRRHFGNVGLLNEKGRVDVLREAVNMKIQSLATADLSLLGLANCAAAGLAVNYFGHDAVGLELPEQTWYDSRTRIEDALRDCMITKPLATLRGTFGVTIDIPIEIEIKVRETKDERRK